MFYVYILQSINDGKYYVGSTSNLKRRYAEHLQGKVKSTKNRRPLELICYEAYKLKSLSKKRELYLKTSDGHKDLNKRFKNNGGVG